MQVCQHFPAVLTVETRLQEPLSWLDAQSADVKLVWRDRDSSKLVVGVGEAVRLDVGRDDDISQIILSCRDMLS